MYLYSIRNTNYTGITFNNNNKKNISTVIAMMNYACNYDIMYVFHMTASLFNYTV